MRGSNSARDPDAGIFHAQHGLLSLLGERERNPPAVGSELDGVAQQIYHDLLQPRRVGLQPDDFRGQRYRQGLDVPVDQGANGLDRLFHDAAQRHPFRLQADSSARDAGNLQEVVHQPRQVPHLPLNDGPGFLLQRVRAVLQAQDVQGVHDRRQRVAEFVREHCQELVLAAVRVGKLAGLFLQLPLHPLALGDVADIALHGQTIAHRIGIADEFDFPVLAVFALQRQVFVTDVALGLQFAKRGPVLLDVLEEADLP